MMRFRKPQVPRISPGEARRQGEITRLAFQLLGRERAISFLNDDNSTLAGRPLDLATASDEGRAAVEAELARIAFK
jgi:hypothetical protein